METGPQSEPIFVEPAEDPFEKRRRSPEPAEPVKVPEQQPA